MDKRQSEKQAGKECRNCRFFRFRTDAPGMCRRYPPRVLAVGGDCLTCWPHVREGDACGEFQPKPRQRKAAAVTDSQESVFAPDELVPAFDL